MHTILFVCSANRYRSPIAAYWMKHLLNMKNPKDETWSITSAGTWTLDGYPATKEAIQKANELGMDLSSHRSKIITTDMMETSDIIIVMESGHKESLITEFPSMKNKIFTFSEVTTGASFDIPDPVLNPLANNVAVEICELLSDHYQKILKKVLSISN